MKGEKQRVNSSDRLWISSRLTECPSVICGPRDSSICNSPITCSRCCPDDPRPSRSLRFSSPLLLARSPARFESLTYRSCYTDREENGINDNRVTVRVPQCRTEGMYNEGEGSVVNNPYIYVCMTDTDSTLTRQRSQQH